MEGPTMECDLRPVVARTGSSQPRGAGSPWTPSIGEDLLQQVVLHHLLLPLPLLRHPPRIAAAVTASLVAAASAAVAVAATAGTAVPETATPAASGTATTAESVRSAAVILLLPWHEQHLQPHPLPHQVLKPVLLLQLLLHPLQHLQLHPLPHPVLHLEPAQHQPPLQQLLPRLPFCFAAAVAAAVGAAVVAAVAMAVTAGTAASETSTTAAP